MRRIFERYPDKSRRVLEILIPLTSWAIITMPFWLSFWHPALVSYFVIAFIIYWFYKSATLAVHAIRAYFTIKAQMQVDWMGKVKQLPDWKKVHHVVIIPEYKEPYHVLRETILNLTKQDYPNQAITLVLATEARDQTAREVVEKLKKEFASSFGNFFVTRHTLKYEEVAGKSSNMAYAGRVIEERLRAKKIDLAYTTVTSCDADAILHPKYFSYLTFTFLSEPDREYHFYQAAILFYSNIWNVPLPGRVLNTIGSIYNLSLLRQEARLINFSTYSLCFKTVAEVGFWGKDVIPEDYHLFFKVYFAKGERVRVNAIFLPISVQAALSTGFWRTMINQYEQYKRWAWGISDVPFVVKNYFIHSEIPFIDRTMRLLTLLENHVSWPIHWFILTLGSTIPPLINPTFARTALGYNLPRISSTILTAAWVFLLVIIILDLKVKPKRPATYPRWKLPILYLQWLSLPVVSFFLSALPGLDAHT
ncbi:glycosyltransferase family 2 protein, partial [Candidatus Gottesmanbacteria bacterium]|nr:glycosyltransferase family 2 protein [Candidatus Gottesmanbacteria bacterium]